MSSSTFKILILSLLMFMGVTAATAYVLYEQEKNGRMIREGMLSLKNWDEFRQGASPQSGDGTDTERLRSLVLRSESDTVAFLAFIDQISRRTGVTISATGLNVVKTSERGFDNLSASFQLQGERSNVERTIELFEHMPYQLKTESLSLSRQGTTAQADLVVLVSIKE